MMLEALFNGMRQRNTLDFPQDELEFIQDLIRGRPRPNTDRREKPFLFHIVANNENGLDVDKFDVGRLYHYVQYSNVLCSIWLAIHVTLVLTAPTIRLVYSNQRELSTTNSAMIIRKL